MASSSADTCAASAPVDFSLVNEEQLTTAVAAMREHEAMLQSLLEAEASQLGALLVVQEKQEAQRAPKKSKRKKR